MRPEDFKLNSDYLSFAQKDKHIFTATIPGGELAQFERKDGSYQFTIPAQRGAIDHIMIKKDSGYFRLGNYFYEKIGNKTVWIQAQRTSAGILTVTYRVHNSGAETITYQPMTFTIKVNTFLPPNVL